MIKKYRIWAIIYVLFALDFFIASKPENKTTTCVFWLTLVVFQIWYEIIKRSDK